MSAQDRGGSALIQPTNAFNNADYLRASYRENNGSVSIAVVGPDGNPISGGGGTSSVGTINVGTINTGTINNGSIVVTNGTVGAGTIVVSAGTFTAGTFNTGTINAGTVAVKNSFDTFGITTAMTITLGTLASSTSGVGRQSNLVTSNTAKGALVACKFTTGTVAPNANTLISVYLLRGDGTITDDGAGTGDAALTVINAPLLGNVLVSGTATSTTYYGVFDTRFLGSLGPNFGVAVVNSSGTTLHPTAGSHAVEYTLIS